MTRADSDGDGLARDIKRQIATDRPFAYCDGCLALRFDVSLDDVRVAAVAVGRENGFARKLRACYGCGRTLEITSASS